MQRSNVVLPQPLGPSSVKNSFCAISKDTRSSAVTALAPSPKTTLTFEITIELFMAHDNKSVALQASVRREARGP